MDDTLTIPVCTECGHDHEAKARCPHIFGMESREETHLCGCEVAQRTLQATELPMEVMASVLTGAMALMLIRR